MLVELPTILLSVIMNGVCPTSAPSTNTFAGTFERITVVDEHAARVARVRASARLGFMPVGGSRHAKVSQVFREVDRSLSGHIAAVVQAVGAAQAVAEPLVRR